MKAGVISILVLVMSMSVSVLASSQLTNIYRLTLVNNSSRNIYFHVEKKECTRYIAPVDLSVKRGVHLKVHWVTSAINCVGRFAMIKLRVERESMDDSYLTLDAGLYDEVGVGVVSGGVPIRCKMMPSDHAYDKSEKIYDFQCTLT